MYLQVGYMCVYNDNVKYLKNNYKTRTNILSENKKVLI